MGHFPKYSSEPNSVSKLCVSYLSLQIINRRKNSSSYILRGPLKFRLCQILLNAIALLAIAGGLAAYFNAYPTVKFINKTIITPTRADTLYSPEESSVSVVGGKNPAPGVCLPVIVKFCQQHQLPYNFTVFPNYIGHFGQPEAQAVSIYNTVQILYVLVPNHFPILVLRIIFLSLSGWMMVESQEFYYTCPLSLIPFSTI